MIFQKTFQFVLKSVSHCQRFVVAFSGGLDSTALLHLLSKHTPEKIIAVHVNHGLSNNADLWAEHCKSICETLRVEYHIRLVDATPKAGESPEDAARKARYKVLSEFIDENSCLLTAHNQDDQAETLLLQCFRGAGPKGLAAMPMLADFSDGCHLRPLLNISRFELKNYVDENNVSWVEDESNENVRYDRNFIRHELMPIIKSRWPKIVNTVSRSARHCAEANFLADDIADFDVNLAQGTCPNSLSIKKLCGLSLIRQKNVLRYWLKKLGFLMPSEKQLDQILSQMLSSKVDSQPHIEFDNVEMRRFQDDLFVMHPLEKHDPTIEIEWDTQTEIELPCGLGTLSKDHLQTKDLPRYVTIRFRQGGERYKLAGRDEHHTLKKLFQENGVAPWLRSRIPLIYDGDCLLEVWFPPFVIVAPLA